MKKIDVEFRYETRDGGIIKLKGANLREVVKSADATARMLPGGRLMPARIADGSFIHICGPDVRHDPKDRDNWLAGLDAWINACAKNEAISGFFYGMEFPGGEFGFKGAENIKSKANFELRALMAASIYGGMVASNTSGLSTRAAINRADDILKLLSADQQVKQ